jgi:hypothetical protein
MRKLWMPGVALSAALAFWGCPKPAGEADGGATPPGESAGSTPEIACDAPAHDFGVVSAGDEVRHTFTVKNKGQGVLKITQARGS